MLACVIGAKNGWESGEIYVKSLSIPALFDSCHGAGGSLYVSGKLPTYPFPNRNINTYLSLRTKCWLREGVGVQFPCRLHVNEERQFVSESKSRPTKLMWSRRKSWLLDYLFLIFFVLQPLPGEVERNLWSSISTVKQLISKTIEVYGLTNLTEEEVSKHGVVIFNVPSLHQENFRIWSTMEIMNNTSTRPKKIELNRPKHWIDRLILRVACFAQTWPPRDLCILVWTGLNSFSRDKQKVKSRRTDEP